jgi:hypothetical protein
MIPIEFKLDRDQVAFLMQLAGRFGWGVTANEAAKTLLEAEITAMQKEVFRARP